MYITCIYETGREAEDDITYSIIRSTVFNEILEDSKLEGRNYIDRITPIGNGLMPRRDRYDAEKNEWNPINKT